MAILGEQIDRGGGCSCRCTLRTKGSTTDKHDTNSTNQVNYSNSSRKRLHRPSQNCRDSPQQA